MTTQKIDLYQRVTDSIVAALEKGVRPWTQPWKSAGGPIMLPINAEGRAYRGINVWLLWAAAAEKGYTNPRWLTMKKANELGGRVRKGEKATLVVFWKQIVKNEKQANGEIKEERIPFLRSFIVFNVEQIDGLPDRFSLKNAQAAEPGADIARIAQCEEFFGRLKGAVKHGGGRAFYSISTDTVHMPEFTDFADAESYYATRGHEEIHRTGSKDRLNREFGKRFGDQAYAAEELVAEMGSAFVCAHLGLALTPRDDHASYLASWIKVLKADKRAIFTASSAAQKAVEFINQEAGVTPAANDDEAEEAEPAKEAA